MTRHRGWRPLVIVAAASVVAAFLGQAGVLVELGGVAIAFVLWRYERARNDRMLLADYVESHSFASDTIADFATSETGAQSLDEARARMDAWRRGYVQAERDARNRRSAAARRAAATRRSKTRPRMR